MTGEWWGTFRRERWVPVPVRGRRAVGRLEQAEREREWVLAAARGERVSVRKVSEAAGLSPTRVHQLTKDAHLDASDAALGQLRAAGRPAPENPDSSDDEELSGRASTAERPQAEIGWLRQCAEWLDGLETKPYPPAANLHPEGDFSDTCAMPVRPPRVAAIPRRTPCGIDELVRARRVEDLQAALVADDRCAARRRDWPNPAWATPSCATSPKRCGALLGRETRGDLAWRAYRAERRRRGETDEPPYTT
ncbi:hypothetical protein [Streptomyces cavernae]|uniref:hypothetical protein n=1 Tax=Streptomyces cavernae TaxID=2259034 RepID=UPI0013908F14|nr:hypothetical protein [Streptomyces cavernae]